MRFCKEMALSVKSGFVEVYMLEKMSAFFESRLNGYDEHMMTDIESANEFYPFTAKQLPTAENCHVLDL